MKNHEVLYNQLNKMGYTVNANIDGDGHGLEDVIQEYVDNDGVEIENESVLEFVLVGKKTKKEYMSIGFQLCRLPNCCGVLELGDLAISEEDNLKQDRVDTFIKYVFALVRNKLMSVDTSGSVGKRTGKLLTFVSNGNEHWKKVLKVLDMDDFNLISTHYNTDLIDGGNEDDEEDETDDDSDDTPVHGMSELNMYIATY